MSDVATVHRAGVPEREVAYTIGSLEMDPGHRKGWAPTLERRALAVWSSALGAGLAAGIAYLAIAVAFGVDHLGQGNGPHFLYLADAFLHGRLSLLALPGEPTDLLLYQGQYFVYYPPLPALLLMPLVALFGPSMSDAAITIGVGALNVGLVSLLLSSLERSGLISLDAVRRAWVTAFFALGTTHSTVAPHPHAASMALLMGFTAMCAAYVAAVRLSGAKGALVAGSLVGAAFLCRNTLILPGLWVARAKKAVTQARLTASREIRPDRSSDDSSRDTRP
ncbi:MAG TPA: hypothetical protein VHS06_01205, partial [Chloroflexota bacterium]|nr:hypothetical protein [Chloroflexota bacterium]